MTGADAKTDSILPLRLENICYQINGLRLLNNVSIDFPARGAITIVGPNGAGKTLLLRICHGLLSPSAGVVRWYDAEQAMLPGVQSMVFQRPVMLRRSARDNIVFAMKAIGIPRSEHAGRLEGALSQASLETLADRPARKLSGGEQQRLALARCMALQPKVLFLDEPTAHLDPLSITQIEALIQTINASGCQVIMVTHDLAQARRLGDFSLFMQGGEVVEFADSESFFSRPQSEALSTFLAGHDFQTGYRGRYDEIA